MYNDNVNMYMAMHIDVINRNIHNQIHKKSEVKQ